MERERDNLRDIPECRCTECEREIDYWDKCYYLPGLYNQKEVVLCEDCIGFYSVYGKDLANRLAYNAKNKAKELETA